MSLFSVKKAKELPEKAALELSGDDILIIEDENNTCQIKLSELSTYIKNGLIDKDSFNGLMADSLSDILTRINELENLYLLKINNVIKTLPINLPGKDQETSDNYIHNENNISLEFKRKTVNEYELIVTENAELNPYYSGGSITDEHKWYGIILETNTNNGYISYDASKSSGSWAEMYSIDQSEKTDVYIFNGLDLDTASQEDVDRTLNSIIVWLRADDEPQTFCFTDDKNNIVKLNVSVNKYVPEEIPESVEKEPSTYAVYQWDKTGHEPSIYVKDDILHIEFNGNIEYTSRYIDNIYTSGHWVGIIVTPPIGFNLDNEQYPKIYYDGVLDTEGWKNLFEQDEEGFITVDTDKANLSFNFNDLKRNKLCTIDWGIGYIDNVIVSVQNATLLFPPIDNL